MLRRFYTLLMHMAIPAILVRLWWRGRAESGYRRFIIERFGGMDEGGGRRISDIPAVWIHAVSVGEVRAAVPLIAGLHAAHPESRVVLTCMTPTGRRMARDLFTTNVSVCYLPYDLPWALARFIKRWRPMMMIVMETELWPNLLAACQARKVPAFLANARLSEKSRRGYARFAPVRALAADAFGRFSAVMAQSLADAERLKSLGANNVVVTGNVKFDLVIEPAMLSLGATWRAPAAALARPILLLASTREHEEMVLVDAFRRVFMRQAALEGEQEKNPESAARRPPLLVVVPRHPSRFDDVDARIRNAGLRVARRSALACAGDGAPGDADVWLGDSMGEMQAYYAMCDVAIIGGSFQPLGGQNLIEAAALGKPVIMGPSTFNFADAVRLARAADAMISVADAEQAMQESLTLLRDRARLLTMGGNARGFAAGHVGATEKTLAVIRETIAKMKL